MYGIIEGFPTIFTLERIMALLFTVQLKPKLYFYYATNLGELNELNELNDLYCTSKHGTREQSLVPHMPCVTRC
jgi:hypothetical protein